MTIGPHLQRALLPTGLFLCFAAALFSQGGPQITSTSPGSATAGGPGFALTVNGSGFTLGATVHWNGMLLATALLPLPSGSQITANVPASLISAPGTATITVISGGNPSNDLPFTIDPPPAISLLSPNSATAGGPDFTLTVNGTGFTLASVINWNGAPLTTTFTNGALTATIPAALIANQGTASVTVTSGGVTSDPMSFSILPPPVISSIDPTTMIAGCPFTLNVTGSNFTMASVVQWNGTNLSSMYGDAAHLTAPVSGTVDAAAGPASVTVSSGGVVSNNLAFTVIPPPMITSVSPSSAIAGGPAFILTVNGTFPAGATVLWNATALATTAVSGTKLTAAVSAALLANPGAVSITVTAGCITSNAAPFAVNPPPAITSLSPSSATAGGPAFTLTVNGSNFASGAAIQWNGSPLTTTVVTATQLTAPVSAGLIASQGSATVTVLLGGVASNGAPFAIGPPATISSLSPNSATAGGPAFTLTVNGSNFVSGAAVQWNGTALTTTFVGATQLTAAVPASLIASQDSATVTVVSGGVTSNGASFTILPPPAITSLSPNSATAGGQAFTLTVNGSNFVSGAAVRWNGSALATTFVSATQLTAAVPASLIASQGLVTMTVLSGGVSSNASPFTILPPPVISALNPNSATAGGPAFILTVNGSNFVSGAAIQWNGSPLTTTFVGATQLTATVPASLIASQGSATVTVTSGGVTSNGTPFAINPPPLLTSLSPSSATADGPAFTLTVNGTGFAPGAAVQWNAAAVPTTFVSATQLTAAVGANFLASAGSSTITVLSGGVTSNGLPFTISPPPVITSLSPSSATATGPAFTLTVNGTSFVSGAVIQWNASALTTSFVSPTQLTATIPATLIAHPGTANVTVTLGGATSNILTFSIATVPVITSLSPSATTAGGPAFTLTVNGSGLTLASAVTWNGTALPTNYVNPNTLTASVSAALIATAGTAQVAVVSGGVASNSASFSIAAGPVVNSLSPPATTAGGAAFTLTVNGSGFAAGAAVQWNGTPLATNVVSATQLTATVSAALIANAGSIPVTVVSGGVTSNTVNLSVTNGPALSQLSPASATAGGAAFTLTVIGTGFTSGTAVQWNTTILATTFVNATQVTAVVPASLIASASTVPITVTDGGITSNALSFQIDVLVISGLSPISAPATGQDFSLTVNGAGFNTNSVVKYNGNTLPTTFNSANQLTATVPGSLSQNPGSAQVTVVSNGVTSAPFGFVLSYPAASISLTGLTATAVPTTPLTMTVQLANAAPADLQGTLTLSFTPNATGVPSGYMDPALQFVAGGTTFNFTIPAGATIPTVAVPNIQQGTVAGQLTVTLTSLNAGTLSLLPLTPVQQSVTIPQLAPIIESCTAGAFSTSGFSVKLDAYSTPRDLQSAIYTFTAASGAQITVTGASTPGQISVDEASTLTAWFAGTTGQSNGSAFSLTTPFTLSGDPTAVQSVSVVLKNSIGSSSPFTCTP